MKINLVGGILAIRNSFVGIVGLVVGPLNDVIGAFGSYQCLITKLRKQLPQLLDYESRHGNNTLFIFTYLHHLIVLNRKFNLNDRGKTKLCG